MPARPSANIETTSQTSFFRCLPFSVLLQASFNAHFSLGTTIGSGFLDQQKQFLRLIQVRKGTMNVGIFVNSKTGPTLSDAK